MPALFFCVFGVFGVDVVALVQFLRLCDLQGCVFPVIVPKFHTRDESLL